MVSTPAALQLYKRLSNDFGTTWGSSIANADAVTNTGGTGTVLFSTGFTNTSFSQFSIGVNSAILPVKLLLFNGENVNNEKTLLQWKVAEEINLSQYEIERSVDGINFNKIGKRSDVGKLQYEYYDAQPNSGVNYYRIKAIDRDGKYQYSSIITVKFSSKIKCIISSNSSSDGKVGFKVQGIPNNTGISLAILNSVGQLVKTQYLTIDNNVQYFFGIDTPGIYETLITLTNGQSFLNKIVVLNK